MGKVCVFCQAPVPGQGEHVRPQWLRRRWNGRGPYTHESSGPSRGRPKSRRNLSVVLLPACGVDSPTDCNAWLNNTFEKPAQPFLEDILDGRRPVLTAGVEPVARWAVKTLLLSSHPEARNMDRLPQGRPWELPADMLPAMRRTGLLPDDLSLWMAIVDPSASPIAVPAFETVMLPRVFRADGAGGTGASRIMGFGTSVPNGPRLVFQLVFHPLTDIEHPLEAAGLVTRLWPSPPPQIDLAALLPIDPAAEGQWGAVFGSGGGAMGLPPGGRWSKAMADTYFPTDPG